MPRPHRYCAARPLPLRHGWCVAMAAMLHVRTVWAKFVASTCCAALNSRSSRASLCHLVDRVDHGTLTSTRTCTILEYDRSYPNKLPSSSRVDRFQEVSRFSMVIGTNPDPHHLRKGTKKGTSLSPSSPPSSIGRPCWNDISDPFSLPCSAME